MAILVLNSRKKSFTLIELLVSMSIVALVAGISISAYPKFSNQLGMNSEVYRILAYIKEIQSYGISGYTEPGKKVAYGFFVSKQDGIKRVLIQNPTSATNEYYVQNLIQDPDETISFDLKNVYEIVGICTTLDCVPEQSSINSAYAIYRRPNIEARIITLQGNIINPSIALDSEPLLVIFLAHKIDKKISKKLVILTTGQMYAKDW
jgi:prepilin-type N-terminal cleavage/methylation domain-containing protein